MTSSGPQPRPDRSGVRHGYVLTVALACAAIGAVVAGLWRDGRLGVCGRALANGDVVVFVDEISSGRITDTSSQIFDSPLNQMLALRSPTPEAPPGAREAAEARTDAGQTSRRRGRDRPPPSDPHLFDPDRHLDGFFSTLRDLEREARQKVRLLYFGTSEIGHDQVTSQMRRLLQERFGDGGKGWVSIDPIWSILYHRDIDWRHADGAWRGYSIRKGSRPDGHYGLGGVLHVNRGPAWVEYRTVDADYGVAEGFHPSGSGTAWSRVELHYQKHPQGGTLSVALDNGVPEIIDTACPTLADAAYGVDVADGPHRVRIERLAGDVHLYGALFERDAGVVLDALMVIGAWGDSILNYDPEHLVAAVRDREPALLLFQYGAKEVLRDPRLSTQRVEEFAEVFLQSIERVRPGAPDAACWVISPKDQARLRAGRIETAPALPKVVAASKRVAQRAGCAYYDLYSAMGGEGTIRRWYHQTPRLVLGDYQHLALAGSIRIGDMLTDVLLDEYDAYLAWQQEDTAAGAAVAGQGLNADGPAPLVLLDSDPLAAVEPCTKSGLKAVDCRDPLTYIRTTERDHPLWGHYIENIGGGYAGVGADESYSFIAEAKSEWAWIFNTDPTLVRLHHVIRALVLANESPKQFVAAFGAANREVTAEVLDAALAMTPLAPRERALVRQVFVDLRPELHLHYRRGLRARPLYPDWGWLRDPAHYAHVRSLFARGRVRILGAALDGDVGLSSIAEDARAAGVPIRVLYLSRQENRGRIAAVGENLRRLPFDDRTVVLRVMAKRWNRARGFSRWHYVAHSGPHLQQLLTQPDYRRPRDAMAEREVLSDCLSWIGPGPPEAIAATARVDQAQPRGQAEAR